MIFLFSQGNLFVKKIQKLLHYILIILRIISLFKSIINSNFDTNLKNNQLIIKIKNFWRKIKGKKRQKLWKPKKIEE